LKQIKAQRVDKIKRLKMLINQKRKAIEEKEIKVREI